MMIIVQKAFGKKFGISFFIILLLFIISSCSQKRDPKNNYLFTRIEIEFIDSCIEDVNIVSYEDEEYIKDSVIRTIDFLKDSLYLYHYRKKKDNGRMILFMIQRYLIIFSPNI